MRRTRRSVLEGVAVELRDWLLDAGFGRIDFYDRAGGPLTARAGRMVTIARR